MSQPAQEFIRFKRNKFSARLPAGHRYTRSHFWLAEQEPGLWRVGLTTFATRMLGEIVEFDFEVKPGDVLKPGQIVGWIEGFKAVSDLFCVATGAFEDGNPEIKANASLITSEPYDRGWLYRIRGEPDPESLPVLGYTEYLGATIDQMLNKEKG